MLKCTHGLDKMLCPVCSLLKSAGMIPTGEQAKEMDNIINEEQQKKEYYTIDVNCLNCSRPATISIPKGELVTSVKCYNCGCQTLKVKYV